MNEVFAVDDPILIIQIAFGRIAVATVFVVGR
ncbi:hypothetical protein ACVIGV_000885 [Rhizobium leguminosarum]|nr:hypothetical protein [Rhizobium leguminosarum]